MTQPRTRDVRQTFKFGGAIAIVSLLCLTTAVEAQAFLSVDRAKSAIARKAYQINGAYTFEYGARRCSRLSSNRVRCVGYVKKVKAGKPVICTDRMAAVKRSGRVSVRNADRPSRWRCRAI